MESNINFLKALNALKNMNSKELQENLSKLNGLLSEDEKKKILTQLNNSNLSKKQKNL